MDRREEMNTGEPSDCRGCCEYSGARIIVYFGTNDLEYSLIAHELFHATARIMQWCGVKYDADYHEAFAFLNGYLTELTYRQLIKWKIGVKK